MKQPRKTPAPRKQDHKTLLSTLKMTTTIGAISLTLAGWGLLSRVEANNVAQATQVNAAGFASAASSLSTPEAVIANSGPTQTDVTPTPASVVRTPTATALPEATATPTTLPTATATADAPAPTPTPLFKLDVVQWLQTKAGDPVAVVRDNRGTLWYVMGTDVPRIENGLSPEFQPQLVNGGGRTRGS